MIFFESGSPRVTAINIGILVSILTIGSQTLIIEQDINNSWKIILVTSLAIFFLVYVIVYFLLKRLIINKIKPIYETIKKIELNEDEFSDGLDDVDIVDVVNKDVATWAKLKTQEIKQLKQLEKYRKEFIGNVSHELKTPIFNIQGFISTLLDGGLEDETINRKYLERAEKSIDRMISIVEDLTSITSIESGEIELDITTFNIVELINEVIEQQEDKAKKRKIRINVENLAKNNKVEADKRLISQVVVNLVVNSINYGKEKGETIITIKNIEKETVVEVRDNGIGIENKHLNRLFERFYRVDKSRSKEIGGTGLGLSIVKHILEAHKKTITVKSVYGEYTVFTFTLKTK